MSSERRQKLNISLVCIVTPLGRGPLPVSRAVYHCRFRHVQSGKLRFELLSTNHAVHNLQIIVVVIVVGVADPCSFFCSNRLCAHVFQGQGCPPNAGRDIRQYLGTVSFFHFPNRHNLPAVTWTSALPGSTSVTSGQVRFCELVSSRPFWRLICPFMVVMLLLTLCQPVQLPIEAGSLNEGYIECV
jgi:hypothetical protein